jgi:DNA-binding NarL/FixJ family response regulator
MVKIRNNNTHRRNTATEREMLIMTLWDQGRGSRYIAQQVAISEDHVMNIISFMCVNNKDRWQKPAMEATLALAARIRDVHPYVMGVAA